MNLSRNVSDEVPLRVEHRWVGDVSTSFSNLAIFFSNFSVSSIAVHSSKHDDIYTSLTILRGGFQLSLTWSKTSSRLRAAFSVA